MALQPRPRPRHQDQDQPQPRRALLPLPQLQETIRPLIGLLDGLTLRHKNQHRSSIWWSRFQIMRRAVRRLSDPACPRDRILAEARSLDRHVIPSWYLAFSQLAADARFAPIGLALLGALATVRAAIGPVIRCDDEDDAAAPEKTPCRETEHLVDLGLSVGRNDVDLTAGAAADLDTGSPAPRPEPRHDRTKRRKRKAAEGRPRLCARQGRDDITRLFESLI